MRIKNILQSNRLLAAISALGLLSAGSAFAGEGGVSGGGGGVAPVDPVGATMVEQALREAPQALSLVFHWMEMEDLEKPTRVGALLFKGPLTIHELVKQAPIETSGECRSPDGQRRDGAAPGKRPNSVCMDVKTLGQKLTEDNYWAQTVALLGHELSHLLGTNETEASELQTRILKNLRLQPSYITAAARNNYLFAFDKLSQAVDEATVGGDRSLREKMDRWLHAFTLDSSVLRIRYRDVDGLMVPSAEAYWLSQALLWKAELLHLSLDAKLRGENPYNRLRLEEAFGSGNSVTLRALAERRKEKPVPDSVANLLIERYVDEAAYEREVQSIVDIRDRLNSVVRHTPPAWKPLIEKDAREHGQNPVRWSTDRVDLQADDFSIEVGGKLFTSANAQVNVNGDPGDSRYWSLELTWNEQGREMKTNIYFGADKKQWWVSEIRTYDGGNGRNWIYSYGDYFRSDLGKEFKGDVAIAGWNEGKVSNLIHFKGLSIRVNPRR